MTAIGARGTCRVCRAAWQRWTGHIKGASPVKHPITDASRMVPHLLLHGTVAGAGKHKTPEEILRRFPERDLVLCEGVGTLCDEARERARVKRFAVALADQRDLELLVHGQMVLSQHERKLYLIRMAKSTAEAALDAVLTGEAPVHNAPIGSPFRLEIPWLMQLAIVAWREATEGGVKVMGTFKTLKRERVKRKAIDVYCTFCGAQLAANIAIPARRDRGKATESNLRESTDAHTIPCALTRLSGMQAFVSRGTFKLPTDMQPDHTPESTPTDDQDV